MSVSPYLVDEIQSRRVDPASAPILLDVQNVSKIYHLWESPRARLIYGLWSQVPGWAPRRLRTMAETRKANLGRNFYALHDFSLQLRRGESVAILGRNGSGKSTLLQIICGTLRASGGSLTRHCQRIAALLELGSGFNPEFTGRENVYLNGAVLGLSKEEINSRFANILEFAEIDRFIDQPVKTYSSGMLVRLAFAVQVQLNPELLIVDEALAVGDIFFQQKCFGYMRQLKERGCSFLIVSHDTSAIQQFCDRGVVLVDGRKYFEGPSQDAIREYRLTEKISRKDASTILRDRPIQRESNESAEWSGPAHWFEYEGKSGSKVKGPAKLNRWSCANASGEVVDQFFPGQKIRLFAEFECLVPVRDASAAFAVRDRTGQLIHAKHQYQIGIDRKISSDPTFLLQCEFSFDCRLVAGEYTVEFSLIDIGFRPAQIGDTGPSPDTEEFFEILCYPPAAGRFSVVSADLSPIKRKSHFGMVDIDAKTQFQISRSSDSPLP
jgi:lipopolysaccharide transport system ATP-binding protein